MPALTQPSLAKAMPSAPAPRPRNVAETGLSLVLLEGLLAKHLYVAVVLDSRGLAARLALAGPIIDGLLAALRQGGLVEVRGSVPGDPALRYALTERGRDFARKELERDAYVGIAPVPIEAYRDLVRAQSVHAHTVTREQMRQSFRDVVMPGALRDELGAAMNSWRPLFVYGPPGTGKTYISRRLSQLTPGAVLIPHAIAVGELVFRLFDPAVHRPVGSSRGASMMLEEGLDPRHVLCERPMVMAGGELTLDMLEIQFDPVTRQSTAPLHLKATNGMCLIDDLGRQRVRPIELFNRWIVPLESREDYLSDATGRRFAVPFDMVLVFSTNLNPLDLADDAFLRRLGHRVRFAPVTPDDYEAIWRQVCAERQLEFDSGLVAWALGRHRECGVAPLPCHPRDLIDMSLDHARYEDGITGVTRDGLEVAWKNYFLVTEPQQGNTAAAHFDV